MKFDSIQEELLVQSSSVYQCAHIDMNERVWCFQFCLQPDGSRIQIRQVAAIIKLSKNPKLPYRSYQNP